VVLAPEGAVAGVDVRGGAPGTRETDLLNPLNTVERVHAVLLTGGSAFGLGAATGVVRWLEARGVGFDTGFAKVPIVVGAVLYDLGIGSAAVRPDAAMGVAACESAITADGPGAGSVLALGSVGAGTGATVGKLAGHGRATKSGIGFGRETVGDVVVEALIAVNAVGEVRGPSGDVLAGIRGAKPGWYERSLDVLRRLGAEQRGDHHDEEQGEEHGGGLSTNTTIGCLWTNARLTKAQASKVAQMAHDGLARSIDPIHTPHDGDTLFVLSAGEAKVDVTVLGALAAKATEAAVHHAVACATGLGGVPSASEWAAVGGRIQS
jgi:L-aminopeptidase/D-esterase-like protein